MFKNIIWDLLGKFGSVLVSFGISIVLTRLLSPHEFGIMAMAMVVIYFAHIFMDFGFQRAIIQQQDVSPLQFSTIYIINFLSALVLTIGCFFLAGPLAHFYNEPLIKPVFRVASLSFLLNGLNLIPSALIYKRMQFKANSIITIIASVFSGAVGIIMAYTGYGIWSLVIQSLLSSFLILLMTGWYTKWWPLWQFQLSSVGPIWKFGSKMFASGVLDTFYSRLDTFIVGKIFSVSTLGYYSRAQSIDNFVRQFSANSIMASLFPFIAKHQHDRPYLKEVFIKYLHIITFVSVGLSGVLFLTASDLFTLLFTQKWSYSAELFQLMAAAGFIWPVSSLMVNMISGVGNSTAFLRLEVYKKIIILPVYLFGFFWGLKGFIIAFIFVSLIGLSLNAFYAGSEIQMRAAAQWKIMLTYFLLGLIATACAWLCSFLISWPGHITSIMVIGGLFSLLYLAGAYSLKLKGVHVISVMLSTLKRG